MKLNYIANSRIPTEKAHGIQIMKMCEAFAKRGCEVELIVPARRNKILDDPFTFYDIQKNFKLTYLPTIDLVGRLPRIGFLIQTFSFLVAAKQYLRAKTGLVYSRELFTNIFFNKTALEIHTLPRKITFIHNFLYKKSKLIVVLTEKVRDTLRGQVKVFVAPDAVDLTKFKVTYSKIEARTKVNLPRDKTIIIYTGHLYSWKGVDTFVEAMKLLNDNFLGVIIGGTQEDRDHYSKKLALQENIKIIGVVKHRKIPAYLKAADIAVLPNSGKFKISRLYTSPMKLFEYMASETPIIASDLPSIREIINEETAYFFKPDNPRDLVDSIKELVSNNNKAETKAKKASELVKKYTWENRATQIIKILQELRLV